MLNKWACFCAFLTLCALWSYSAPQSAPFSKSPLILDHSDQMNAAKQSGVFDLNGNVRMHHDEMRLSCQKAVWYSDAGILDAQGQLSFEHPEALLDADTGRYERLPAMANVWGNARYRTRDQKLWLTGQRITYKRMEKIVEVTTEATLTDIPKEKDKSKNPDTLFITSDRMLYNDMTKIAYAWGNVKVRQGALRLRADSLRYQRLDSSLWLMGRAYGKYKGWKSTAAIMHSVGGGKKIKLLEGFGQAKGIALADTTGKDTTKAKTRLSGDTLRAYFVDGKLSEVRSTLNAVGADYRDTIIPGADSLRSLINGDFLIARFKNGKMNEVLSYPHAKGTFFGDKRAEEPSQTTGDTLRMIFKDGKADTAWVFGNANSTYHYYKDQALQGRNETKGNDMIFAFGKGKVKIVDIHGELAKGTWYGLASKKSTGAKPDSSKTSPPDSTAKLPLAPKR